MNSFDDYLEDEKFIEWRTRELKEREKEIEEWEKSLNDYFHQLEIDIEDYIQYVGKVEKELGEWLDRED